MRKANTGLGSARGLRVARMRAVPVVLVLSACLCGVVAAPAFAAPLLLDHQYFHISANPMSYTVPAGNNRMLVVCASVRTNSYGTANVAQLTGATVDGTAMGLGASTYRGGTANVTRMGAAESYQYMGNAASSSTVSVAITGPNLHWPIAVDIFTFGNVDSTPASSGSGGNADTGATTSTNAVATPGPDYLVVTSALHFSYTATSVLNPVSGQSPVCFNNRESSQHKTTVAGYLVPGAPNSVNYQFTNSTAASDKWASVGVSHKSKYRVSATAANGSLGGWTDASYDYNVPVSITAAPAAGFAFGRWEANVEPYVAGSTTETWVQVSTSAAYTFNAGLRNDNQSATLDRNGHALRAVFVADTEAPTGSILINGAATLTNNTLVNLALSATDNASVAEMQFNNDGGAWSGWEAYGTSKAWTLDATDGARTVSVQYRDAAGNVSADYSDTIILETVPPTGTVAVNGGAAYTTDTAVALALAYADGAGSGVVEMQFSNDSAIWSGWEAVADARAWVLASGDGSKTVYVQYKDAAGNVSAGTIGATITLDTAPPTGTVAVSGGAAYTGAAAVTLTLTAADGSGSGVVESRFSNDNTTWSGWQGHSASMPWTLESAPDGLKSVYVQFKDAAGNVSVGTISDTILLDTAGPTGTVIISGGAACTGSVAVTLNLAAGDGSGSGVSQMRFSNDSLVWGAWQSVVGSKAWTLATGDGIKTVYAQYNDAVGNVSAATISDTITLDTTAPTGTVVINGGAAFTGSAIVALTLSVADGTGSGVTQMRFSNDGAVWSVWGAYSTGKAWTLESLADGLKTVLVQYKDLAGNVSAGTISDAITLDTTVPTVTVTGPVSPTMTAPAVFTLTFSEPVSGLLASEVQLTNGTPGALNTADNQVYTLDVAPSGQGTVTCQIPAGVSNDAGGNGNSVSNTLSVLFDSVAPTGTLAINGGMLYTGSAAVTLSPSAEDGTGSGVTHMRFSNDGTVWSAWEAYNTGKPWTLGSVANGLKTVYAEYRDGAGNLSTGTISASITLDTTLPTAVISLTSPSPTAGDTVTFTVAFSEAVGASFNNATVGTAGTLAGTAVVAGTDPSYNVTVTPTDPNANGTVGITIPAGVVVALSGNAYAGGASALCTVYNWPGFAVQPQGAKRYVGDGHALEVQLTSGGVPTSYRWRHDDGAAVVDGPGAAQWPLTGLAAADAGDYWCEVTFDGIMHASDTVTVEVQPRVRITSPPVGGEAAVGGSHEFTVVAEGGYGPLSYQWMKGGTSINGAFGARYLLSNLTTEDSGDYRVEISDTNGDTIESVPVTLNVATGMPVAGLTGMVLLAAALGSGAMGRSRRRR